MIRSSGETATVKVLKVQSRSDQLLSRQSVLEDLRPEPENVGSGEVRNWGSFNYFYVGSRPPAGTRVELVLNPRQPGDERRYEGEIVLDRPGGFNRHYVGFVPHYECGATLVRR